MRKICPKCKGKGWYYFRDASFLYWLGFSALLPKKLNCKVCDTQGYIKD